MRCKPIKKYLVLATIVGLGIPGTSFTQVPDSLDSRGYFPLEVDNIWEYEHNLYRPWSIFRTNDESEIRHERYHVVDKFEARSPQNRIISRETFELRYEEETATIVGNKVLPTILSWLRCLDSPSNPVDPITPCWAFVGPKILSMPDLFGMESVEAKGFGSYVWGYSTLHGVGILEGGGGCEPCSPFDDSDNWKLRYAKIGDKVYGAQIVGTDRDSIGKISRLQVYPNPTSNMVSVTGAADQEVELIDILGRKIGSQQTNSNGLAKIDLGRLPPGNYLLTMGSDVKVVLLK